MVPPAGDPRKRWLRSRLERLLREDTEPCAESAASNAIVLLCLFESVTGEQFTDTVGVTLDSRVRGFGRSMAHVVRTVIFEPPMLIFYKSGRASWSRRPSRPLDVEAWRQRVLEIESFSTSATRMATQRAQSSAVLADWLKGHRYLAPVEVDDGETSVALLFLWEVDHSNKFPCADADNLAIRMMVFTKAVQRRASQDAELSGWLQCKEVQRPLAPGKHL